MEVTLALNHVEAPRLFAVMAQPIFEPFFGYYKKE